MFLRLKQILTVDRSAVTPNTELTNEDSRISSQGDSCPLRRYHPAQRSRLHQGRGAAKVRIRLKSNVIVRSRRRFTQEERGKAGGVQARPFARRSRWTSPTQHARHESRHDQTGPAGRIVKAPASSEEGLDIKRGALPQPSRDRSVGRVVFMASARRAGWKSKKSAKSYPDANQSRRIVHSRCLLAAYQARKLDSAGLTGEVRHNAAPFFPGAASRVWDTTGFAPRNQPLPSSPATANSLHSTRK